MATFKVEFNIDKFRFTRLIETELGKEFTRVFVGAYFYARKIDGNVEIYNKTMDVLVTKVPAFYEFVPTTTNPRRKT